MQQQKHNRLTSPSALVTTTFSATITQIDMKGYLPQDDTRAIYDTLLENAGFHDIFNAVIGTNENLLVYKGKKPNHLQFSLQLLYGIQTTTGSEINFKENYAGDNLSARLLKNSLIAQLKRYRKNNRNNLSETGREYINGKINALEAL